MDYKRMTAIEKKIPINERKVTESKNQNLARNKKETESSIRINRHLPHLLPHLRHLLIKTKTKRKRIVRNGFQYSV
jgi:hypothetical protein